MADKPRVKAPKQRECSRRRGSGRRTYVGDRRRRSRPRHRARRRRCGAGMSSAAGRGRTDTAGLRTTMQSAGCTLQRRAGARRASTRSRIPARRRRSGTRIRRRAARTTRFPPSSASTRSEIEMARLVHNLEHGGIYILYGKDVPDSTVEQLRSFYEHHKTGTIMAPLDRLGDKFALGAWVVDGSTRTTASSRSARASTRTRFDVLPLAPVPGARALRPEPAPARDVGRTLRSAGVAERVRRARLKSGCPLGGVRVRVPPPASRGDVRRRSARAPVAENV